ncbi:putative transcription factor interactor and regulator CCHC(Zn) family [Helianthus annuus]|uniref:Transcription factor interactor and regulator CCHC(Zn) family n=1 Tax=Helianthus annuus TaxID=4232 RepID=A0A9K3E0X9_HELAN|nr:putative transcription factor interactor and regulator CCHC(Zn) family [Helianthus annuus]KAJ0455242.1 putative transcription factor interactor and regulator CCHC(Zn) family [Helianthus annuus]KAJ0844363.1 putative transcription factor interactor and regulator CCHC(Zn) family [Helianthus annuus]
MKPMFNDNSAAKRLDIYQSGIRATSEDDSDLRPTSSSDEERERRWLQRRCNYCNKPGHQISTCKMKEDDEETQLIRLAIDTETQQPQSEDHVHESSQRMEYLVIGTDGGFWSEMWYVSKSLKHHYSGNLDMFKRIKGMSGVETKTGENQFYFIRGIGVAKVTSGSEKMRIQSVFYTPDIDRNVLSLDQLITQGFAVKFIGDKCKLFPAFSVPLINKKSDITGITREEEVGMLEKQSVMNKESEFVKYKTDFLNEYFENLDVSSNVNLIGM